MEERKRDTFLWIDLSLTALAAARIYYLLAQCQEYLSFAGFAALLGMVILLPGFLCLLLELFLLYAGTRGHARCPMAAYILQVAAGLPGLGLLALDAELFGELWVFAALLALGAVGALRELRRGRRSS